MPPPSSNAIGFRFNFQKTFLKPDRIMNPYKRTERRVLNQIGAFTRRTAKQSIRKRRKASKPGTPPSSHTGGVKRNIFFAYDRNRGSVVIGPIRLGGRKGGPDQPRILEEGGTTTVQKQGKRKSAKKRVFIQERPFMGPAKEKNLPKLPELWRDAIR
jgi:hypothetical protein